MICLFDDFDTFQEKETTQYIGTWLPINSTRTTENCFVENNYWKIVFEKELQTASLSYNYEKAVDCSFVSRIILCGVKITTCTDLQFTLTLGSKEKSVSKNKKIKNNFISWIISEFDDIDTTQLTWVKFEISGMVNTNINIDALNSTTICLPTDTYILTDGGFNKQIQFLKAGDYVMENHKNRIHKIKKIIKKEFTKNDSIDVVIFGSNYSLIDGWHPSVWISQTFSHKYFHCIPVKKNIPKNTYNDFYTVYHIQLETNGFFVANNTLFKAINSEAPI